MTPAVEAPARRTLDPWQVSALKTIIAMNPGASNPRIAELFLARTGRSVTRHTVRHHRRIRPREPIPDRSGWFAGLPPAERDALLRLMDENPALDAVGVVALLAGELSRMEAAS